jgi:hypothetical protein
MHADDVDPIDIRGGVGDEGVHVMPVPGIRLSINDGADCGGVIGRDRLGAWLGRGQNSGEKDDRKAKAHE